MLIQTGKYSLLSEVFVLKFAEHIWIKMFNADCLTHWSEGPDCK